MQLRKATWNDAFILFLFFEIGFPFGSVDADLGQDLGMGLDLGGMWLLLWGRLGAAEGPRASH